MLLPLAMLRLGGRRSEGQGQPGTEDQLTESKDGRLLDGTFSGEVAKYHPNKKAESYSSKGKLHGPFITYREDGSPAFQVTFADGIEHGPFKRWFEDGKLWWRKNVAGKLEGISQTYFSNGKLQCSPFIGREKRKDSRLAGTRTASNAGR